MVARLLHLLLHPVLPAIKGEGPSLDGASCDDHLGSSTRVKDWGLRLVESLAALGPRQVRLVGSLEAAPETLNTLTYFAPGPQLAHFFTHRHLQRRRPPVFRPTGALRAVRSFQRSAFPTTFSRRTMGGCHTLQRAVYSPQCSVLPTTVSRRTIEGCHTLQRAVYSLQCSVLPTRTPRVLELHTRSKIPALSRGLEPLWPEPDGLCWTP
jgi:hypothetical protein